MWRTIQVGKSLYCLSDRNVPEFKKYERLDHKMAQEFMLAKPREARFNSSLSNYANEFIFVIGGNSSSTYEDLASTSIYEIETNKWKVAPDLN